MGTMSWIFFGLMLLPLLLFVAWLLQKDRKRSYIGIFVLIMMAIIAIVAIVKFDANFMEKQNGVIQKSGPSYK